MGPVVVRHLLEFDPGGVLRVQGESVAVAPPGHVADTKANDPYGRRKSVLAFFYGRHPGRLAIPRRYGASWIVLRGRERHLRLRLPRVYSDSEFTLYRLAGSRR